jgi:D-3-phosphoglycerate dehydrogenase
MNKISPEGLNLFPRDRYEVASDLPNPDALLVRSADLHDIEIPETVKVIARAGAGVNNIPIPACTDRGIVVFNTPGGNANAVKELAIASLLLSSRRIVDGISWSKSIADKADEVPELVEKGSPSSRGRRSRGRFWASWAWAPSASWWPTTPSPWAWRSSATTRSYPWRPPGACRGTFSGRIPWRGCS